MIALSGGGATIFAAAAVVASAVASAPVAGADNSRLNNSVVSNVFTVQRQHGCTADIAVNPALRLAAQWHTDDVLNNRALDADVGTDGSTVQDRARAAGFRGAVAETVAVNESLAINNLDIINQWFYRPDYLAIMSDCAHTQIGVWSENSFDRSVVVAVYGHPAP
ncbi:CAP domain-containing protein [Mycolicibacterium sp. HS_4_1]